MIWFTVTDYTWAVRPGRSGRGFSGTCRSGRGWSGCGCSGRCCSDPCWWFKRPRLVGVVEVAAVYFGVVDGVVAVDVLAVFVGAACVEQLCLEWSLWLK